MKSQKFPAEEKYELSDQPRRSSRAICRVIGEGYRKRQYPKHSSSKMSDADTVKSIKNFAANRKKLE